MYCLTCNIGNMQEITSYHNRNDNLTFRVRKCSHCNKKITTRERVYPDDIKFNGKDAFCESSSNSISKQ